MGTISRPAIHQTLALPLYLERVPCGFPSPAQDYVEDALDLNKLVVKHPCATYFIRVSGESMIGAGIGDGDLLVVDRSLSAEHGDIVVASIDGEFTVKELRIRPRLQLVPHNIHYSPIIIGDEEELHIFGGSHLHIKIDEKMYALVDVNNFYTSCETVFRPDLAGRPIVVLSNNDGCIISRSAEAKALGIKMGAPYFKVKEELRRAQVAVFSSNYSLYADLSNRVMLTLHEITPAVEVYSIDEAFITLPALCAGVSLTDFGHRVRDQVRQNTGLTVGVGIAPTKTLAKMANFAAKKWPATRGVVDLSDPHRQRRLLSQVAVEDVWGVGYRLSKKLNAMGIVTALHLADCSGWVIRKNFNVVLERTMRELRGEPCMAFDEVVPTKQQIMCSRSFGHRITDYEEMHQAVCFYAERAAEKLRAEGQFCGVVSVFIRTSPHADNEVLYGPQACGYLSLPSCDTRDIIRIAIGALDRIWKEGLHYMKAGVMLSDFFSRGVAQLNLFDAHQPRPNSDALMNVIDKLNQSGRGTVWFAGQGTDKSWAMKRTMLSPAYTTRFSDLPVAK